MSSEAGRGWIAAGEAVGRDAGHRPRLRSFFSWALFHRFQLLLAMALVGFPWFARGPAAPLLANLFVLGPRQLVVVAALAVVAGQVLVIVTWTSTRAGPLRLWPGTGDGEPERAIRLGYREFRLAFRSNWGTTRRWARRMPIVAPWLAVALGMPTLITLVRASAGESTSAGRALGAVAIGVVAGQGVLLAAAFATAWLTPAEARHGLLEGSPWARKLARVARRHTPRPAERLRAGFATLLSRAPFGPGYVWVDPSGRRSLHSGHLASMGLFAATAILYAALGVVYRPGTESGSRGTLPALGALLVVSMMAAWILPGLAFLLDRFRMPVLTALLVVSFTLFGISGAGHTFALRVPAAALPHPEGDFATVDAWFAPAEGAPRRPIVAVAAAGGGITAAAWTATVLSGLASGEHGAEFLASLKLVTGVSGGAVGAMYFVDRLPARPLATMPALDDASVRAIREAASASSLDAVGWGLAYPDLLRTLASFPFAAIWPELDRSAALEASWRRRLAVPSAPPTLASWRLQALAGEKPMVLFGATVVESGRRLELATLAVRRAGGAPDFWCTYPGRDLEIPTAARLSATFPFVSLAARGRADDGASAQLPAVDGSHLVDGGYADNSGSVAAIAVLDHALTRRCPGDGRCDAPPIVLYRVRAFDESPRQRAVNGRGSAWLTSVASPLMTLLAVRTASQAERNDVDRALFESKWRARGVEIAFVDFDLGDAGPLSWKLTASERAEILRRW